MTQQKKSPVGVIGANQCCNCKGYEYKNPAINLDKAQEKMSLDTRHGLSELCRNLTQSGDEDLTTRSAISACAFLLQNY